MVEASLVNFAELGVLVVGVVVALRQLRDIKQTRQAELYMRMLDKSMSQEGLDNMRVLGNATWSSYEEWLEKYHSNAEYRKAWSWLLQLYEAIGVCLRLGLVDIKLLALHGVNSHIYWWEKHKDLIYNERKRRNNRRYRSQWEYLYNELVKYLEEHPELAP
jgi:hypothetical protein